MADPGRTEQIIAQFLLKTINTVLAARIPRLLRPISPTRLRRRDRWFNLPLPDLPPALDHIPSFLDPVIIDIIISPRGPGPGVTIERWTAHCDPAVSHPSNSRKTYKNSIVLLRSLYSVLRLLPAYRVFRLLCSPTHLSSNYDISYRVSSFAEPFSRDQEMQFKPYNFTALPTHYGQLSVSVAYRPSLSEFSFEAAGINPPLIIPDYVGSPAAEPLRMFPASLPDKGMNATSFLLRVRPGTDPPALTRPHSWANAPMAHHPLNRSPGPVYPGFDAFKLSPPFSSSPTPSPPAYSGSTLKAGMRTESAPVSIPQLVIGRGAVVHSRNMSDPARSPLPPMSPRSSRVVAEHSLQESPSESRSFRKLEGLRLGDYYSNLHWHTANKGSLKDGRDDSGRFSGVFSSGGSPRFGISRSSSRLSIQDDLDDGDYNYPFAVDDVDTSESQTRKQGSESTRASTSSHKSQDAAVGVLVHMLKTAPPLRPDHSFSSQSSKSELGGEFGASSSFISRKASDALEELQSYKEMKDILLSQSGTKLRNSLYHRGN